MDLEIRRKRDLERRKFHKIFLRSFEYPFSTSLRNSTEVVLYIAL